MTDPSTTTFKTTGATPLVSVVLPVYNHARYVVEAVESVRLQTLARWELIIINDGSTDDSLMVLRDHLIRCDDARIQLHSQANAGSHAALNRGLAMAKAPYLAILNSDDRYVPERLQRLVDTAQATMGGEAFIVTGLSLIDELGEPMAASHWWHAMYRDLLRHWHAVPVEHSHPAVEALLWGNFTVSTSNFFMSRALFERMGPFCRFRYVPDWEYALRVSAVQPTAFRFLAEERLLDYRLHGKNTILGGALRNHAEAYQMLRMFHRQWAQQGNKLPLHAIDRLHYLSRFIRHEHARLLLERQKVGWLEQIEAHQQHADQLERQLNSVNKQLNEVYESQSWRLTAPLRKLMNLLRRLKHVPRWLCRLPTHVRQTIERPAYEHWLHQESIQLQLKKSECTDELKRLPSILVSIVMPVHNTPIEFLRAAVVSVQAQWYPHWELCVCNDASTCADTLSVLGQLVVSDPRIRIVHRPESGHIVRATNDALTLAQGTFVVFMDHDDVLAPHALLRLMQELSARPDSDIIYSDEDKLDEHGSRCLPLFKPDWSPALQWSQNYVGHIMCVRRSLLQQLGGLAEGTDGSQDYDLVLRLAAAGARFAHVPEVLYHWRMHPASTSISPDAKPYAHHSGKQVVARHLAQRYGAQFDRVDDCEYTFVYAPRFVVPQTCLVSIVIPTRDKADLLKACIRSIREKTQNSLYEIIVLDNGSTEEATNSLFKELVLDERIRIVLANIPFNWSRLNNIGRRHARGNVLVFLNNDTLVISPDWLQRLSEYALLPDVATVGPMLLYPDNTIQHAGVVVGMGGWADHVFKGEAAHHYPSPYISNMLPRNVLANTGACVAVATERFDQLGEFDESFEICGSDVELGIRAHKRGYQNIYLPTAKLYHLESKTRSAHVPAGDFEQSALKYAPYRLEGDPFFNPNLDLNCPTPCPLFPEPAPAANSY